MLEAVVERRLRGLKGAGFVVLKLHTPGHSGVMDRMILWPKYCPKPPSFVEIKKPGKSPRALQAAVADEWVARGVDVWPYCDTVEKVDEMIEVMVAIAKGTYNGNRH